MGQGARNDLGGARMKHLTTCAAFVSIPFLLLTAVSSAAGTTPTRRVIIVKGGIEAIAMDGARLAYEEHATRSTCDRIFVDNVISGRSSRVRGCRPDFGSRELAVAGGRVAWIVTSCGNSECNDDLATAALPVLRARSLAHAHSEGDVGADQLEGSFIGSLVGSGNLLAVNRFTTNAAGAIAKSGLDGIGTKRLRRLVSGPKTFFAQEADSGRIAVLRRDGGVGIYNASGRLLLEVMPGPVDEEQSFRGNAIALQGDHLLVLAKTGKLEIYNSHSGALVGSWPVPRGATYLDAFADVAVYAGGPGCCSMHVLRLTTGKDVVFDRVARGGDTSNIQLEAAGLVYVKSSRTLVFVSLRRVLAAVS
jgi:hypothetical protein